MKKAITFIAGDYHKIIDVCTPTVDKAASARPMLCNIELQVKDGECIATSLNGYIMAQCRVHCNGSNGVYIIPSIKMKWYEDVTITQSGNKVSISQGDLTYTKTQEQKGFIDWKKITNPQSDIQYSIYIKPQLAKLAIAALKGESCVRMDFRRDIDAIQLVGKEGRALLLPMKYNSNDDHKWFNFDKRKPPIEEPASAIEG